MRWRDCSRLAAVQYAGLEPYHLYAEVIAAAETDVPRPPIVFLHGGAHTGSSYRGTPDGRPGWADLAAQRGWTSVVVDWPGHGRAGRPLDFARMSTERVVEACSALLERLGPVVLLTHSMSGPIGWKLAECATNLVLAVVAVAPGPPGNIQPVWSWPAYPEEHPIRVTQDEARHFVNSPRFPMEAFERYFESLVPESARVYNERLNVRGTQLRLDQAERLHSLPILVVSADVDPNHPGGTDERTAQFVGAEHLVLSRHGLHGFGHLMMIERDNDAVLNLMLDWLERCLNLR